MKNTASILVIFIALTLLLGDLHAQDCNHYRDINDCYPALNAEGLPSSLCCEELNQHSDCLCNYISINQYMYPPNYRFLRNITESCGILFPYCPE